jgi:hypothetical protein
MTRTLAIGWDVGGWSGKKHGFAAFLAEPDAPPRIVGTPCGRELLDPLGDISLRTFVEDIVGSQDGAWDDATRVVIGIDAPLGFPRAFAELLAGTPLPGPVRRKMAGNAYAYRDTDRHVEAHFKQPLSGSFDKLGNNATVAMHHVARWRHEGLAVLPFDRPDECSYVALEVYPAILRISLDGPRPGWYRQLVPEWANRTGDDADAVVCAAMALAWACPGAAGLPEMCAAPDGLPTGEGWIYYPRWSEWK